MRIVHTCVNVPDAAAAVEWYEENLGFEETWAWDWETEAGRVESRYVSDGETEIQLRDVEGEEPSEAGDLWDHVGLVVDDVDAAVDRIDHAGLVMEPQDNDRSGARIAFVETPQGHVLELLAPYE
jgi:lactoylglutathione lyase